MVGVTNFDFRYELIDASSQEVLPVFSNLYQYHHPEKRFEMGYTKDVPVRQASRPFGRCIHSM